jgi:rubrerythrin
MPTAENLKKAFAGESQANRMYLAFAKKAEEEGFPQIARLFRGAAAAETVHAHAHFRVMGGVEGTAENLKTAINGETHEFTKMYPEFLKEAEAENAKAAITSFRLAMAVEKVHGDLYTQALQALRQGKDLPKADLYVCDVCGHTHFGEPPDRCPVCGGKKELFKKID